MGKDPMYDETIILTHKHLLGEGIFPSTKQPRVSMTRAIIILKKIFVNISVRYNGNYLEI